MDAVIELLVNKVASIVEENVIKDEVKEVLEELKSFNSKADENADGVVEKIKGVVDEAQDAIDEYVVDRRNHLAKGFMIFSEKVPYLKKVNESAKKIDGIKQRAVTIRQQHTTALHKLQSPTNVIHHQVSSNSNLGFHRDLPKTRLFVFIPAWMKMKSSLSHLNEGNLGLGEEHVFAQI